MIRRTVGEAIGRAATGCAVAGGALDALAHKLGKLSWWFLGDPGGGL